MATLFTALDISTMSTSVTTALTGFIGVNLLFLGYRYVKKIMNRG